MTVAPGASALRMSTLADAYRGRRVFVTGHTGFKGAWLSLWLAELGAEVHGYALNPPTTPSLFDEARVAERLASHRVADVRDAAAVAAAVREVRPEVVLHLAAQPLVRRSYREPRETFDTNVMGTVNVLEAVRATPGVRACQVVTSDKCYENRGWAYAYRENDPMGGADPYSASKGCAELVVAAYRRSFLPPGGDKGAGTDKGGGGPSLASVRAGNVIGGGDWAEDRIIPDSVRALAAGEAVPVRNPRAVRPWQHVLEPLGGYLLLAARQWADPADPTWADGWNFGPPAAGGVPVRDVVNLAVETWGSGTWVDRSDPAQPHEAHTLKLDVTKACTLLGWRPVLSVREAVAETVGWYRRRAAAGAAFDARGECLAQIHSYASRAATPPPHPIAVRPGRGVEPLAG
jgi:CDP-glucose 4,6-dehydratase